MKKIMMTLLAIAVPLLPMSSALSAEAMQAFGFNAESIKGFPTGEARLTGGGVYDPETGFVKSAGGSAVWRTSTRDYSPAVRPVKASAGIRWKSSRLSSLNALVPLAKRKKR